MSLATYSVKCNPDMVLYLGRYRCAQCKGVAYPVRKVLGGHM